MRCLDRNKVKVFYALFFGETLLPGTAGEYAVTYSNPIETKMSVSPNTGSVNNELFGADLNYDNVLITDDVKIPIDESTVFFIGDEPEMDEHGNMVYTHIVKRIARSLNTVSIAVSKVDVS